MYLHRLVNKALFVNYTPPVFLQSISPFPKEGIGVQDSGVLNILRTHWPSAIQSSYYVGAQETNHPTLTHVSKSKTMTTVTTTS